MKILGISGNLQLIHENSDGDKHDAAAVLLIDGSVVSAIEEERLNRIKHSDKFPSQAIRFVLRQAGIGMHDLDQICYYSLPNYFFEKEEPVSLAGKIQEVARAALGCEIDEKKLYFVHHHLAPYGNPGAYRDLFKSFYTLLPGGRYTIDLKKVKKLYLLAPRRQKGEPFTRAHKDIAAALQESVEEIVMHILKHYQTKNRHTRLCLAGGVAHNCSMNGKVLYSGMFEEVFVQPAAHDAGCALGAALYRYHELEHQAKFSTLTHLYWGTPTGDNDTILKTLTCWEDFLQYEKVGCRVSPSLAPGRWVIEPSPPIPGPRKIRISSMKW